MYRRRYSRRLMMVAMLRLGFPYCSPRGRKTMLENWWRSVPAVLLSLVLPVMSTAQVGINISASLAPPALPFYEQPAIPADGYRWTPGYWGWSDDGGSLFVTGVDSRPLETFTLSRS